MEALVFLSRYYRDQKQYDSAQYYVQKLFKMAPAGQSRDEANRLL